MITDATIAHAKALLGNGVRITELMVEREKLISALGGIDEELGGLLANGQLSLQLDTSRAKQTCRYKKSDGTICGSAEHTSRTCPHKQQGGSPGPG